MNSLRIGLMSAALVAGLATASAQTVAADSVMQHVNGKRLSVGGYGEVAMSRNFYSDAGKRYSNATAYKNAPDHGRFDIPHAVIYLGYDFGKGWTMGTEIEFEHGGTGQSIEYEAEEAIEPWCDLSSASEGASADRFEGCRFHDSYRSWTA